MLFSRRAILSAGILLCVLASAQAWSGNVCQRIKCRYYYQRVCRYRFWGICCSYKYVRRTAYYIQRFCCYGWTHNGNQNCNIPVCRPPCQNGGTCVSPGRCQCPVEYTGYRCGSEQCSHVSPCYPGTCLPNAQCDCSSGFTSPSTNKLDFCRKIEDAPTSDLQIYAMQVRMSYWPRHKTPPMEEYWIMADSTDLQAGQMDFFWTNQKDFNRLETTCSSQFFPPDRLPTRPPYIGESEFGIVEGNVDIWLSKIPRTPGASRFLSKNATIPCAESVSGTNPEQVLYECNVTENNFDRLLEHGDFLKITYSTKGGGYRQLLNRNTVPASEHSVQEFVPISRDLSVEFRFDFEKPYHCGMTGSCSGTDGPQRMLHVPDVTTSSPITITWDNWLDDDSKVARYAIEVFKLKATNDRGLEIKPREALQPLRIWEVNQTDVGPQQHDFEEGGMYAIVMQVADNANNSIYLRRFCLYDPDPIITFDPAFALYVASASPAANYSYQSDASQPLVVTWNRHFRNAFHEDNALLGAIRRYPPMFVELKSQSKYIPQNQSLEDEEGARQIKAIANERGIVNFKIGYAKDSNGGRNNTVTTAPHSGWINLDLQTTYTLPSSLAAGNRDTVTVWVKATDITGHEQVDITKVSFDSTTPNVLEFDFRMNVPVPGIEYSSIFDLVAEDLESGIASVLWTFRRKNGTVLYTEEVPGKRVQECSDARKCSCTPAGDCFTFDQQFAFSNCHMMVEKDSLATEVITVTADVTNMAGLVKQSNMTKGDLTTLNGTQAYHPPQNITASDITGSSVTLTWIFPSSCFERTALWVIVDDDMRPVHKDASVFDVTGLRCETTYTIFMVTDFAGNYQSDKAPFTFTTTSECPPSGLTTGAIIGLVIGLLILLALVALIVIFVLYRRRVILQQPGVVNKQMNRMSHAFDAARRFTTRRRDPERAFSNNAYKDGGGEDEIYMYGQMTFNTHQTWQMADSDLTLLDHVAEGKFANIYKATWRHDGRNDTVAAKMLKPGFSEDDALKMMAKINFFATQFDDHDNVIRFLGAVTDNTSWGPVLVMEYCENGQMDKWLATHRDRVGEQTMEDLLRFSLGVAKGMEYLASKHITHRRLAARNVLLTFILDVKIAGFGPQHKEGTEDKMTRVPAKWAAPEVLEDKPPTEKSDVWSYGVVLWEIFSMGQVPYPNIHANQIGTRLKGGYRMEKPELAEDFHYEVMKDCWQYKQSKRPTFKTVRARLEQHFSPGNRQSVDFYYDTKQLQ